MFAKPVTPNKFVLSFWAQKPASIGGFDGRKWLNLRHILVATGGIMSPSRQCHQKNNKLF
jgi:hypothetical protein